MGEGPETAHVSKRPDKDGGGISKQVARRHQNLGSIIHEISATKAGGETGKRLKPATQTMTWGREPGTQKARMGLGVSPNQN